MAHLPDKLDLRTPPDGKLKEEVPLPPRLTDRQLGYIDSLTSEDRVRWLNHLHQMRLDACRKNVLVFGEYVMKDEETLEPVVQGPLHRRLHELIDLHSPIEGEGGGGLVAFCHIEAGKTAGAVIQRALFEIGCDATIRGAIGSSNEDNAGDRLSKIAGYITASPEYKEVFPHVKISLRKEDKWLPSSQITIHRPLGILHPTLLALGTNSNVLSRRFDMFIGDDMLESKHVSTKGERDSVLNWFLKTIGGRFTRRGRAWILGVPHHREDLLHMLIKFYGWVGRSIPVMDPDGTLNSPARWTKERVARARIRLGPFEAARQLDCKISDDEHKKFKDEWVQIGINAGAGLHMRRSLAELLNAEKIPAGYQIYSGIDMATDENGKNHKTCFFTILVYPDRRRRPLNIWAGNIEGPDILQRIRDTHRLFGGAFVPETVAAQKFIVQFLAREPWGREIRVMPFNTRNNKWDPIYGVQSLAVEMHDGMWLIPNVNGEFDPEVSLWMTEMSDFNPDDHTGDRLMACWFAREGARRIGEEAARGGVEILSSRSEEKEPLPEAALPPVGMDGGGSPEEISAQALQRSGALYVMVEQCDMFELQQRLKEHLPGCAIYGAVGSHIIVRAGSAEMITALASRGFATPIGLLDEAMSEAMG